MAKLDAVNKLQHNNDAIAAFFAIVLNNFMTFPLLKCCYKIKFFLDQL